MAKPVRKSGLLSTVVDGQVVIYETASHQTHCINALAAQVWNLCDGQHDRDSMVRTLEAAGKTVADTGELVDAALDRFAALGLLDDASPIARAALDRRALGAAAMKGLAAGLVVSVMVPERAAAASVDCSSLDESACLDNQADCTWIGLCVPVG